MQSRQRSKGSSWRVFSGAEAIEYARGLGGAKERMYDWVKFVVGGFVVDGEVELEAPHQ